MSLGELQDFMADALRRTGRVHDYPELGEPTRRLIAGNQRLTPLDQLDIYREQFWLRHVDALREDFVTIEHLLGHDGFVSLCERYLATHPPRSFTLRDLGDKLAAFVAANEPYASDVLLGDAARLEWAFVDAFDAPDAPPLALASITSASEDAWTEARILLHPSVQRVEMQFPAHELRAAVRRGENPGRPERAATNIVVYRSVEADAAGTGSLKYIDIEPLAFRLLGALAGGAALAAACEAVASSAGVDEATVLEPQVGAWFQAWAAYGWIARVDFPRR